MIAKTLFTLPLLFAMSGCSTTESVPDSYYYILDSVSEAETPAASIAKNVTQIKVRPVILPDYLNQANLVMKLSDHQIKIANYHFWAEDLRQSIQQVLIKELNNNSQTSSFGQECANCDELVINIDHFYPTETGEVLLSGSYYRKSNYQANKFFLKMELKRGGYDEAVSAMRKLLTELAQQI